VELTSVDSIVNSIIVPGLRIIFRAGAGSLTSPAMKSSFSGFVPTPAGAADTSLMRIFTVTLVTYRCSLLAVLRSELLRVVSAESRCRLQYEVDFPQHLQLLLELLRPELELL
jgi:hypothetical protein